MSAPGHVAPLPGIFGGLGFSEMLMIAFVAILVFGGRLPEVLRNFGQAYARVRRSLTEMSAPIRSEIQRATELPPEPPAYVARGLPDVAPSEVPSVPYGVGVPAVEEPTAAVAAAAAPEPLPPPSPWPTAPGAPEPPSPLAPPPPPHAPAPATDLDEPRPV